jgi:valyl-tRNA synthetase
VDTPPPTVSGQIHIGHVFSYTQADIAIRYHRMRGEQVFYPFGFDDNGLPTERFTESVRGITAREVGRAAFIEACLALSAEVETQFERFWQRLGLSVDWRLRYSTIDTRSRRIAQQNFLDLHGKGLVERREAPTLWCPQCETAVAQADMEDRPDVPTSFVTLAFPITDGRQIHIATTRPELLPACVAILVQPGDTRYGDLIGATAITPLFGQPVPILADPDVDTSKGTGAVMCCTFGDVTDVRWWYRHSLPLRIAISRDGRMSDLAGPYAGLRIRQARARIIADLTARGLILAHTEMTHDVGVHERCATEIEYLVAGQWFISVLTQKERLLEAGRQIDWYPGYMRARYESWVQGLTWDWNISRQRYYGVPFPVWYCEDCAGVVLARPEDLPVDPTTMPPPMACARCGSMRLRPETDVMDTWATSSLTPRICASLAADMGMDEATITQRLQPMAMRPNAHDIIRTWDFYTIVQSLYHSGAIPWRAVMIAGHAQDPSGKKISKSKLKNASDPTALIEQFSADAVRYWTAGVRTGSDTTLSEEAFRQGQRLVTKLWHAARFVLLHANQETAAPASGLWATDRWLLMRLGQTVVRATAAFEVYELATARTVIEQFFWSDFCDTYLELVKYRLLQPDPREDAAGSGRDAAVWTLRTALYTILQLFAPLLPHITEAIFLDAFIRQDGPSSIHLSRWPDAGAFPTDAAIERAGMVLLESIDMVRRWKAGRNLSVGAPVAQVTIHCEPADLPLLREVRLDLRSITRADTVVIEAGELVAVTVTAREQADAGYHQVGTS